MAGHVEQPTPPEEPQDLCMAWPRAHGTRSLAFATPSAFRTRLNRLVLSGQKVATTGLLSEYDEEGEDLEQIGEHLALVDNADK